MVDSTVGYPIMSFMDAFSDYHHIRMHPADMKKTSFITTDELFCYEVMSFGLKNAGATYRSMMDKIFSEQKGRNIEVYVDDLLMKSKSPEQHLIDLRETFATLRKFQMCLNPLKCLFGAGFEKFLGYLLIPEGIKVNLDKMQEILKM